MVTETQAGYAAEQQRTRALAEQLSLTIAAVRSERTAAERLLLEDHLLDRCAERAAASARANAMCDFGIALGRNEAQPEIDSLKQQLRTEQQQCTKVTTKRTEAQQFIAEVVAVLRSHPLIHGAIRWPAADTSGARALPTPTTLAMAPASPGSTASQPASHPQGGLAQAPIRNDRLARRYPKLDGGT